MIEVIVCIFLVGTLLCEIALVVAVFKLIHILGGVNFPWQLLEKLVDAWKERPTQPFIAGGPAATTPAEKSRGPVPSVDELPPEVIAPSLRKMQKSSGFGSGGGGSQSDTQLHQRDKRKAGGEGRNQSGPEGGDDKTGSASADSQAESTGPDDTEGCSKGGKGG